MSVWDVFDAAASRFEGRTAIEVQKRDSLETHTYRALRHLALSRAGWLHAQGIGCGDRCAILADNDAWWCGAYLGILRIGAVAVPLDTNYSSEQVRTILENAGARVVFVSGRFAATARAAAAQLPDLRIADIAAHSSASPECDAAPLDPIHLPDPPAEPAPALILYTSGTTADPKGVVLSHANLIAGRDAAFKAVAVTEEDAVLGALPLSHALAQLTNLLLPFAVGARVVFLDSVSSTELLRALTERGITVFACVPQVLYLIHQRLLEDAGRGGFVSRMGFRHRLAASFAIRRRLGVNAGPLLFRRAHAKLGPRIRFFLTGGSRFDPAVGRDFYALGFTILQAYGLTETSGAATLTRPDDAPADTVGRPLPGQEVKILPASEGELEGEVAIRGPIVMQGYFNRADVTAAVMQDGWFLSGDLGRIDGDGRLTITGRRKDVIILSNGKNIYPEEVEAQYKKSAFVKEICVLGIRRAGDPSAERLHAVVVPDSDLLRRRRIANAGDLLRFEMEGQAVHLPAHKRVPGYDVWFEALPRTTTGEPKRHEIERRLRDAQQRGSAPEIEQTGSSSWAADPHTQAVLAIIRARLPGRSIRPEANLELDLGLDSMARVELLAELEQRFGVRIDPDRAHEIFTVAQLVRAVRSDGANVAAGSVDQSWDVLLDDSDAEKDPALLGLLERRPLAVPILFAVSRMLGILLGPDIVSGRDRLSPQGPYIISPNHQSFLDPFILCAALPYAVFRNLFFVGAAEYFETPLTRWLARKINLMPVDPDANLLSAMKASAFGLRRGKILVLFPEGERSIDGTVKRFKKGGPILAQHLAVPIVPAAIKGAFELWPRNRPINWRALMPFNGHRVRVAFGSPIRLDRSAGYGESANQLRDAVVKLWGVI